MNQSPNPTLKKKSAAALLTLLIPVMLLIPGMAAADSHLGTAAPNTAVQATAQVNFKIIIPQVLLLNVPATDADRGAAQSVTVASSGRNVAMTNTTGSIILRASARKSIAQDVACTPPIPPPEATRQRANLDAIPGASKAILYCTASTP